MGMLSVNQIQFSEKTLYILPASIVSVILNITLNIILIPKFGAIGAVIALSFTGLISSIVHLFFGLRLYPLPLKWWKLTCMFLVTLAFTVSIYPIMAADMNFLLKIVIKLFIILLFIVSGLKLNYVSQENIRSIFRKMFPQTLTRLANQKT